MSKMRVLSFGGGVQSTTLVYLAARGEIAPFDIVVFADTGHERQATYEHIRRLQPVLAESGMEFVVVGPKESPVVDEWGGVLIPAFSVRVISSSFFTADWAKKWLENLGVEEIEDLSDTGQIRRQCTYKWKIEPVRRYLREVMRSTSVKSFDLALGISKDEALRKRPSDVPYIRHVYPLIEELDEWTRADCERFLRRIGAPIPPRSACVFCPFQSDPEWRQMGDSDRQRAIEADETIRLARRHKGVNLYVHRSGKPLREVFEEFEKGEDARRETQLDLWVGECDGVCGL